ncbi:MAG TPA: tetratricopeptide repeat protein [Oculatellaceae cyanobacterium]
MATAKDEEIFKLRSALSLARLHFEQGLYDRAEPVYRRALLFFEHGDELRQCLQCLAVLYSVWNHYSDALEMYVRLLALNENEYGKTDRRTIAVMREMASIYIQMGQPQKAEKLQQKALMRERDRDRPHASDDEDFARASSPMIAQFEQPVQMETQSEFDKLKTKLRPVISGLQVDFTNKRTLLLAKLISAAIVLVLVLLVGMILPRNPTPLDVYKSIPHEYITAGGKAKLILDSDSQCTLTSNGETVNLPYSQFLSDWRDVVAIMTSSIFEKQYWIARTDDQGLLDGDNHCYYGLNTPEEKTLEQMQVVKKAVESFFIVKQRYPKRISEKIVLPYINPTTHFQELPAHQILELGDRKWTTATSIKERANFYNSLLNGGTWPSEPAFRPSGINCASAVMVSAAGEFYDFILRGCDRAGKPLRACDAGASYLISLQGAKELECTPPKLPFSGEVLIRPRHVWLFQPNMSTFELEVLRHAWTYLSGAFMALMLFLWAKQRFFSTAPASANKYLIFFVIGITLAIASEISLKSP